MKKILCLILCFLTMLSNIDYVGAKDKVEVNENFRLIINGKVTDLKNGPIIIKDEVLLPYNELLPRLGVVNDKKHIIWDSTKKSLTIYKDNIKINIKADSSNALVNNKSISLTTAPVIHNSVMYIPASFVSEKLNKKYVYDGYTNIVAICELKAFNEVKEILQKAFKSMNATKRYRIQEEIKYGSPERTNNFINEVDNINKVQHLSYKEEYSYFGYKYSDIGEIYSIKNDVYLKQKDDIGWRKPDLAIDDIINFYNEISMKNLNEVFIAGVILSKDSIKKEIILEGDIVQNSRVDSRYRDNYTAHTKIVLNKDSYLFKEINYKEFWTYPSDEGVEACYDRAGYIHNQKYYDINANFEVKAPSNLDALDEVASNVPLRDDIYGVTVKKGKDLVFTIKREEIDLNWKVIAPITRDGDVDGISGMNYDLTNTEDYEFIDANPTEYEKYGLKNPQYTFEYETKNGVSKIYIGKKVENAKKIYVMLENNKVYAIDLFYGDFLDDPLKCVIDPFVYLVGIWDVSDLEVKFDGTVTKCSINANEEHENDTFIVNGKEANGKDRNDRDIFRKFYASVIGVLISGTELSAVPKGDAEITFTYTLKVAPYTMKIEFIPKDKEYYYVMENGKYSGFIVAKSTFAEPDGLKETYKELMDSLK